MTTCSICTLDNRTPQGWTLRSNRLPAHVECADVRLFVYGTLRAGQPLAPQVPFGVIRIGGVKLAGHSLYLHPDADLTAFAYPVMVEEPGAEVVGELLFFDYDSTAHRSALDRLIDMEEAAGYLALTRTVSDCKGVTWDAQVLVWPYPGHVGAHLGSDWVATPEARAQAKPAASSTSGAMGDSGGSSTSLVRSTAQETSQPAPTTPSRSTETPPALSKRDELPEREASPEGEALHVWVEDGSDLCSQCSAPRSSPHLMRPSLSGAVGVLWRRVGSPQPMFVVRVDDRQVWEGDTMTACGKWAKENGVTIIRPNEEQQADDARPF